MLTTIRPAGHVDPTAAARTLRAELTLQDKHAPLPLALALLNHCQGRVQLKQRPGALELTGQDATGKHSLSYLMDNAGREEKARALVGFCGTVLFPTPEPAGKWRRVTGEEEAWARGFAEEFLK